MPDPVLILTGIGVAAAVAAATLALIGWPWWKGRPTWIDAGWPLAVCAGFLVGCAFLGVCPHWPPSEDLDRLLAVVMPSILGVELLASLPRISSWLIWPLRLVTAAGTARVLLHGSGYVTNITGPGTSEWPPAQQTMIFAALAAIECLVWVGMALLARRAPGSSVPLSLAIAIAGSAVTIMLSGYSTGGQSGLPLASALAGATLAAVVLPRSSSRYTYLGVPLVGLFGLLVIGRFFGQLTTVHALLLVLAPLVGWLPELIYPRRFPKWARSLARLILVGAVVSGVLVNAQREFEHDFQSPSGVGSKEPSVDDYMNFGK